MDSTQTPIEAKNCWDHFKCCEKDKGECRACKRGLGRFCWYALPAFSPKKARGLKHCYDCEWYKRYNRQTAINPAT